VNKFSCHHLATALGIYLIAILSATAATSLQIKEGGYLSINSADGQAVTSLASGSVSETIQSDNQSFKVSYGKDLKGNSTLIIYADPENPQSLDLNVYGRAVQMTEDAVLTITGGVRSPQAVYQAGVLGTVTIDGNTLPSGGTYTNDAVAYSNNTLPLTTIAPTTSSAANTVTSDTGESPMAPVPASTQPREELFQAPENPPSASGSNQTNGEKVGALTASGDRWGVTSSRSRVKTLDGQVVPSTGGDSYEIGKGGQASAATPGAGYQGLVVREVHGDAMYSRSGVDPMDMLRNGTETPRLKPGDVIPPGAQIRTGPNSKVIATPFPGVAIQIQQNTSFGVPVSSIIRQNGSAKRQFEGYLTKGGVLSAIKGIPPEDIDFKIRTPQGVAAARGTVYATYTDGNRTLVVTEEGSIILFTPDGTITITVETGNKAIITRNENGEYTQEEYGAGSEELQLLEDFLADVQQYLDDETSGLPPGNYVVDLPGNPFDDLVDTLDPVLNPEDIHAHDS
jgi:hypothetical protein